MKLCLKRKLITAIKFHIREAKIWQSIYHYEQVFTIPDASRRKIIMHKRCANILRIRLHKLKTIPKLKKIRNISFIILCITLAICFTLIFYTILFKS